MATRRYFLLTGSAAVTVLAAGLFPLFSSRAATTAETFEVSHDDAEWRARLSAVQYDILRRQGTERPYASPLNDEHRDGIFACAGCDLPLFSSRTKFDSHTGWPSFWAPLAGAVAERADSSFGVLRTEVHCRRCGGHLGHLFDDGPRPTGLRYCMNGAAMTFAPPPA